MLDSGASSELLDPVSPKLDFEDGDIDDELDPAMKEELDRFVNIIRAINDQLFCLNDIYILTGVGGREQSIFQFNPVQTW